MGGPVMTPEDNRKVQDIWDLLKDRAPMTDLQARKHLLFLCEKLRDQTAEVKRLLHEGAEQMGKAAEIITQLKSAK